MNKPFGYIKDESVYIYQFCEKMLQSHSNYNHTPIGAIYDVEESWGFLLNRKE